MEKEISLTCHGEASPIHGHGGKYHLHGGKLEYVSGDADANLGPAGMRSEDLDKDKPICGHDCTKAEKHHSSSCKRCAEYDQGLVGKCFEHGGHLTCAHRSPEDLELQENKATG